MVKNRILYLLALGGALVFYGFFYVWFSEFLLILLLSLPVASFLLSLPAMLTLRPTLEAPERLGRGAPGALELKTKCPFPQPRCVLTLRVTNGLTGLERKLRLRPERLCTSVELPTEHCGELLCRATRGRVCDYLGLIRIPRRWPLETRTLVQPGEEQPEHLPGLAQLRMVSYRPKPGGGFAERHELRDYRPGDSLRQVHWKLTAKTDKPIVREPQVPHRRSVVLTLDLAGSPEVLDGRLARAMYLSRWLLEQEIPHEVRWFSGQEERVSAIQAPQDLTHLSESLCRSKPTHPTLTATHLAPNAFWHYHVTQ